MVANAKTDVLPEGDLHLAWITEVWHTAHFCVSYGRCTTTGSSMRLSKGFPRRWAG